MGAVCRIASCQLGLWQSAAHVQYAFYVLLSNVFLGGCLVCRCVVHLLCSMQHGFMLRYAFGVSLRAGEGCGACACARVRRVASCGGGSFAYRLASR